MIIYKRPIQWYFKMDKICHAVLVMYQMMYKQVLTFEAVHDIVQYGGSIEIKPLPQ